MALVPSHHGGNHNFLFSHINLGKCRFKKSIHQLRIFYLGPSRHMWSVCLHELFQNRCKGWLRISNSQVSAPKKKKNKQFAYKHDEVVLFPKGILFSSVRGPGIMRQGKYSSKCSDRSKAPALWELKRKSSFFLPQGGCFLEGLKKPPNSLYLMLD